MSEHSLNGPSSFSRRIGCPGSARMEKDIPSKSSPFAAEGTAAHAVGEYCLKNGITDVWSLDGRNVLKLTDDPDVDAQYDIDGDMCEAVQTYVDYCSALIDGDNFMVEQKFQLPFLGEGTKGTSDFTALKDNVLNVVDYKHGKGVPVDALGNVQGMCYGLGAMPHFLDQEWDVLRITIVQPRAYHELGPVRTWDVPREELLDYMVDYADAAKKTFEPDAKLGVGSWCRFCNAKPMCPKHVEFVEESAEVDFADNTSKPVTPDFLTDEQIRELVLNRIPVIEKWCGALKDYAQQRAEAGDAISGTKLVKTRATRKWIDPAKAEDHFRSVFKGLEPYNVTFKSAPQMEKLIGKKKFADIEADLVHKTSTGVTLVDESDPRPNARMSAGEEFGSVLIE